MCPYEEKLTAWLLGDLPPGDQETVTRHLETCAACRAVRDDLQAVLTPLRSGLAKDRLTRVTTSETPSVKRNSASSYVFLRRAALWLLCFGTVFVSISLLYQSTQRERTSGDTITQIRFQKGSDEPPLAELHDTPPTDDAVAATLPDAPEARANLSVIKTPPVSAPLLPEGDHQMPRLPQLVRGTEPPAAAETTQPEEATASTQKTTTWKKSDYAVSKPPANITVSPLPLASFEAPTNTASSNAVLRVKNTP